MIGDAELNHEELYIARGSRSGESIAIAVHSSELGPAIGGCRIRPYASLAEGVQDAMNLSRAMTLKCSLADLPHGGGKAVAILNGCGREKNQRHDLICDIAELIERLDGRYITGPDIGTTSADMALIHRLASGRAFCRPEEIGGSGSSSVATARGVRAALNAVVLQIQNLSAVAGLRIGIIGLGSVGRLVGESLVADGAEVLVADSNESLRESAERSGLIWTTGNLLHEDLDVLVPAAIGGLLSVRTVATCRARAIVGPANNQLTDDAAADALRERDIVWVPDVIASAGGIIHAVCREELAYDEHQTNERIDSIGIRVTDLIARASSRGINMMRAAEELSGIVDAVGE